MRESFRQREARERVRMIADYRLAHPSEDTRDPYTLEDGDMHAHSMSGAMSLLVAGLVVLVIGTVVAVSIGAVL